MPVRRRFPVLPVMMVLLPALAVSGFGRSGTRGGVRLLDQVLTMVALQYVDTVPADSLYAAAARGLVTQLNDPYSELLSPRDLAAFVTRTEGRYSGIGLLLSPPVDGHVLVERVFPNTPAAAGGVRPGDRVLGVDSVDVRGWSVDRVTAHLLGAEGTAVRVRLERPGLSQPLTLDFRRAPVRVSSVPFHLLMNERVGYVPVTQFSDGTADDVAAAIGALQDQGATGVVLDLRDNPGGIVDEALGVANLFLPRGRVLLAVRTRSGTDSLRAGESPRFPALPLVLLVNGASASSAEIVAGALQDHQRAVVLGTTTFGKGLVQSVHSLDGGYALKLTTGRWFTPLGRSIHTPRSPDGSIMPGSVGVGAIIPQVSIAPDTIPAAEQRLRRALAPHAAVYFAALTRVAQQYGADVAPDFTVPISWRSALIDALVEKGVRLPTADVEAGGAELDRAIEDRIARLYHGDSTVFRRQAAGDHQFSAAHTLLRRRTTQSAIVAAADSLRRASDTV